MKPILAIIVAPAIALAFAYRIPCEQQSKPPVELPEIEWQQGTTPLVQLDTMSDGLPIAADTNMTVRMLIGPSATSAYYAVATNNVATSTYYRVQWPVVGTNTASAAWWYTVYFEKAGLRYWTGNGVLRINATTSTDADGLTWQQFACDPAAYPVATNALAASAANTIAITNEAALRSAGDASTLTNAVAQAGASAAGLYQPIGDYLTEIPAEVTAGAAAGSMASLALGEVAPMDGSEPMVLLVKSNGTDSAWVGASEVTVDDVVYEWSPLVTALHMASRGDSVIMGAGLHTIEYPNTPVTNGVHLVGAGIGKTVVRCGIPEGVPAIVMGDDGRLRGFTLTSVDYGLLIGGDDVLVEDVMLDCVSDCTGTGEGTASNAVFINAVFKSTWDMITGSFSGESRAIGCYFVQAETQANPSPKRAIFGDSVALYGCTISMTGSALQVGITTNNAAYGCRVYVPDGIAAEDGARISGSELVGTVEDGVIRIDDYESAYLASHIDDLLAHPTLARSASLATVATSGLYSDLTGTPDLGGYVSTNSAVYEPISTTTTTSTNTVLTVSPAYPLYRIVATNSTAITPSLASLDLSGKAATWETWVQVCGTNVSVALPSTNIVRYLDSPNLSTSAAAPTQTVYLAWRAWTVGATTNIVCNPYDKATP